MKNLETKLILVNNRIVNVIIFKARLLLLLNKSAVVSVTIKVSSLGQKTSSEMWLLCPDNKHFYDVSEC